MDYTAASLPVNVSLPAPIPGISTFGRRPFPPLEIILGGADLGFLAGLVPLENLELQRPCTLLASNANSAPISMPWFVILLPPESFGV